MLEQEATKQCKVCGNILNIKEFYTQKMNKDGLYSYCKTCFKEKSKHYKKNKRVGQENYKKCSECKEILPISNFCKDISNRDELKPYCKKCQAKIRKRYPRKRYPRKRVQGQTTTIEQKRKYKLYSKYGITSEQYDKMLTEQNGLCAICKQPETRTDKNGTTYALAVDHCHKTGKVRKLLCWRCNTKLHVLEDENFILAAEIYLNQWN